jgi:hypothetical protein
MNPKWQAWITVGVEPDGVIDSTALEKIRGGLT